jgi:hypothetical protein
MLYLETSMYCISMKILAILKFVWLGSAVVGEGPGIERVAAVPGVDRTTRLSCSIQAVCPIYELIKSGVVAILYQ